MAEKSTTISAQNTFTSNFDVELGALITISGTFVATISLQKLLTDGSTYVDVTDNNGAVITFTAGGTYKLEGTGSKIVYRLGVKTGNYTSGTVNLEMQYI